MIQNTNDIYNLIKSPSYVAKYNSWDNGPVSYHLFNKVAPYERISVFYIDDKYMDIYKFNHMNSEYYERVSRKNKDGKKIREMLFAKRTAAMVKFLEEYSESSNRFPHR